MKPKGPLDSSTYKKWLRQKANSAMFNNDTSLSIPQTERKSIVSKSPSADLPVRGLLTQLGGILQGVQQWIINQFYIIPNGVIPRQVASDSFGIIYVTNVTNGTIGSRAGTVEIRKTDNTNLTLSIAGDEFPVSVSIYNNKLYVGCSASIKYYDINRDGTTINTFLTNPQSLTNIGNLTLSNPRALSITPSGTLYFTNSGNSLYKTTDITSPTPTATLVNNFNGGAGMIASPDEIYAVVENGNDIVYIANIGGSRVIKIDTTLASNVSPVIVAGTGTAGYNGDNIPATTAQLNQPRGLFVDSDGSIYIGDTINGRVRKIDRNGIITTFAGTGVNGNTGDGGLAINATLSGATALGVSGVYYSTYYNMFLIVDTGNLRIRSIRYQ